MVYGHTLLQMGIFHVIRSIKCIAILLCTTAASKTFFKLYYELGLFPENRFIAEADIF